VPGTDEAILQVFTASGIRKYDSTLAEIVA
jgi:hypothetical protein